MRRVIKKRQRVVGIWSTHKVWLRRPWIKSEEVKGMSPMLVQEGRPKVGGSIPEELMKGNMFAPEWDKGKILEDEVGVGMKTW